MKEALSKEIISLRSIAKDMAKEFREVNLIYLHGSLLLGFEREDSDVDLAVIIGDVKETDIIKQQLTYSDFFESRFKKREIDLKIINTAPLAFKYSVIKKGEIIFSRNENFRADFEVEVTKKYLDFKYYYDQYNQALIDRLAQEGRF